MACSAELVESKNWNEYSETFFLYPSTTMDEIVLLLMLKLLRKARNVPSWLFWYLRVWGNFISLITFYCKNIQENENFEYSQCLHKEWGASDNLILKMQTTIVRSSLITSEWHRNYLKNWYYSWTIFIYIYIYI